MHKVEIDGVDYLFECSFAKYDQAESFHGKFLSLVWVIEFASTYSNVNGYYMHFDRLPNTMNLLATVIVFAAVIYMQGSCIEIPIKSNRFHGQYSSYPIKLFYTSNMPIMLQCTLVSNVFTMLQMLATCFPSNILVKILDVWKVLKSTVHGTVQGMQLSGHHSHTQAKKVHGFNVEPSTL
ncbi:hypothetical protein BDR06DRAFT_973287 [Suillus hirtellus]|nr:hypothetical protein BDR06DRAFT_973287 [Suillus hirtellus]